jgi:Acetyltransferases, including N-acetylases of ribosomal proteins
MTLLEEIRDTYREGSTPVLETERLVLRAPRLEDAIAVVTLASDRRVAENTARIPHPYRQADADEWISCVNADLGKQTFLITLDGAPIGACGIDLRDGPTPELGYWLGAPYWGEVSQPRPHVPSSITPSNTSNTRRCRPARGSAIRHRAGCLRNAASNGPALDSTGSAP